MTGKPGIIYLQKDKFQLYSPLLRQIIEFRFVPEIVRDSDVINPEMLENLIKVFITNTKLPPSSFTIILADNAYFVKDFVLPAPPPPQKGQPVAPPPQMTMETIHVLSMDFVEHVPYENVVSKSIPLKNGIRVCAVNKDFFEAIKSSFTKIGFAVDAVYPGFILGGNLSAKPVLDNTLVSTFFAKVNTLKEFDLLRAEIYKPEPRKGTETSVEMEIEDFDEKNKKPDKKRLYIMVGFLAFLLIILVVVYLQSLNQPPPKKTSSTQPAATANTIAAPIPTIAPTAAIVKAPTLAVQITNASTSDTAAQTLREGLGKFAFKTLTLSTQSSATPTSTVVSFSGNVTQEVRNAVLDEIRKVKTNITVQERQDGEYDITIVLAN